MTADAPELHGEPQRQCGRRVCLVGDLLTVLPLAFVMIAGPQIISAVFLATSVGWARNSLAYIVGAAVSITLVVTIASSL